jgi:hypothetical protein
VRAKTKDNVVERPSSASSITIPFERTFLEMESAEGARGEADANFCGCGWPQNMLVPKGAPDGFPCQLFVMISNFNDDKVISISAHHI